VKMAGFLLEETMLWWKLQQLKSSKPEVRAKAAQDLGAAKQTRAVPSLVKNLNDDNQQVRITVIDALGAIGHPASVEPLISALTNLPKTAKSRLQHSDYGGEAAEYESLANALASLGSRAVVPLLSLLGSENKEPRRWAAYALGKIKDPRAIDPLTGILEDSRSEVRKAVALALGEIGDSRALKALMKALGNRDLETRRAAAEALGAIGSEAATDALAKAVEDQSELVQLSSIGALAKIGGLPAAACLRSAATSPRKAVRDAVEAALRSIKLSPANVEERAEMAVISGDFAAAQQEGAAAALALIQALGFKDPQMRAKAAETLGSLQSPETVRALLQALRDHSTAVQEAAMRAVVNIGTPTLGGLESSLAFYDASVARLAARALGQIGNARSVPALVEMIAGNLSVSSEYPEMLDAIAAAVDSLAGILSSASGEISQQDLERITRLPEEICLPGSQPPRSVNCTQIRNKAREKLLRRTLSSTS